MIAIKYLLFTIILILFCGHTAKASEFLGRISTDPNSLSNISNGNETEEAPDASSTANETFKSMIGAGTVLIFNNSESIKSVAPIGINYVNKQVLGISIYKDGTLVRSKDNKIFVIQGRYKKRIANLKELIKYRGQAIYKITDEKLAQYENRNYLNGDLIRQKGSKNIYVIKKGKKQLVSLKELRTKYFGLKIFNISAKEMQLF